MHLFPSPTLTYTHWQTHPHRVQDYVCLSHLSEIIQFSGWIRLCVPRAEIKIKILNKQEALLFPQLPVSPSVSAAALLQHILPLWPGLLLHFSTTLRLSEASMSDTICSRAVQVHTSKSVRWGEREERSCFLHLLCFWNSGDFILEEFLKNMLKAFSAAQQLWLWEGQTSCLHLLS